MLTGSTVVLCSSSALKLSLVLYTLWFVVAMQYSAIEESDVPEGDSILLIM